MPMKPVPPKIVKLLNKVLVITQTKPPAKYTPTGGTFLPKTPRTNGMKSKDYNKC